MELSPAEEAIIGLLRGEVGVDFTLNAAWHENARCSGVSAVWTVALSSEGDGILAGRGETFLAALHDAFGTTPGDGEEAPAPKPVLAVVGGTDPVARRA